MQVFLHCVGFVSQLRRRILAHLIPHHALPRLREDLLKETDIHVREMEELQAPIIEGILSLMQHVQLKYGASFSQVYPCLALNSLFSVDDPHCLCTCVAVP